MYKLGITKVVITCISLTINFLSDSFNSRQNMNAIHGL